MSILGLNQNSSYKYANKEDDSFIEESAIDFNDGSLSDLMEACDDAVHELFVAIYEADCIELQGKADLLLTESVDIFDFDNLLLEADEADAPAEGEAAEDKKGKLAGVKKALSGAGEFVSKKASEAVEKIVSAVTSVLLGLQKFLDNLSLDAAKKAQKICSGEITKDSVTISGYDYPLGDMPSASALFDEIMNNTTNLKELKSMDKSHAEGSASFVANKAFKNVLGIEKSENGFKAFKMDVFGADAPQKITFNSSQYPRLRTFLANGAAKELVADIRKEIATCKSDYRKYVKSVEAASPASTKAIVQALNIAKTGYIRCAKITIEGAKGKVAQALKVLSEAYSTKKEKSDKSDNK